MKPLNKHERDRKFYGTLESRQLNIAKDKLHHRTSSDSQWGSAKIIFTEIGANGLATLSGSGCGIVGREVASDTRHPWFKLGHWQILFTTSFTY